MPSLFIAIVIYFQLACVQAIKGIDQDYMTLITLWKFFHYSPKHAQSLKEVQKVLDLPKLKVVKLSDTCWLAHEHCVKTRYGAIVTALHNIYNESHEPEALGTLCKKSTITAIYFLDYVLSQVAKLSKALQTKKPTPIHILPSSLDDTTVPAANWVIQELKTVIEELITASDITLFQD